MPTLFSRCHVDRARPALRGPAAALLVSVAAITGCGDPAGEPEPPVNPAQGAQNTDPTPDPAPDGAAQGAPADDAPESAPPPAATPAAGGDSPLATVLDAIPPTATVLAGPPPALPATLTPFFRLIEDGRSDVARIRIRKHLAVNESDGLGHFLFGLSYHRERRYAEAIPWFVDAIRLSPTYGPTFYFAAWSSFYLGDLDIADRLWRRHLAHQPEAADTHFGLGLVALERGQPEDAATRFRRAIAIEEDEPAKARSVAKSWARLGDALSDLGRPEEARAAIERAVDLWPDHHEAWARLARLARRLGDEESAIEAEAEAAAALARIGAGRGRRP